jgi:hypothetical protein
MCAEIEGPISSPGPESTSQTLPDGWKRAFCEYR